MDKKQEQSLKREAGKVNDTIRTMQKNGYSAVEARQLLGAIMSYNGMLGRTPDAPGAYQEMLEIYVKTLRLVAGKCIDNLYQEAEKIKEQESISAEHKARLTKEIESVKGLLRFADVEYRNPDRTTDRMIKESVVQDGTNNVEYLTLLLDRKQNTFALNAGQGVQAYKISLSYNPTEDLTEKTLEIYEKAGANEPGNTPIEQPNLVVGRVGCVAILLASLFLGYALDSNRNDKTDLIPENPGIRKSKWPDLKSEKPKPIKGTYKTEQDRQSEEIMKTIRDDIKKGMESDMKALEDYKKTHIDSKRYPARRR